MRTEAEIHARLASTYDELAVLQKQYRDLTETQTVQDQGIQASVAALEGMMARLRAFIRALDWVLDKA